MTTMSRLRITMRKLLELIRMKYGPAAGAPRSHRELGASLALTHTTINRYLARIEAAGLNQWPLPADMTEADVEAFLFPADTLAAETASVTGHAPRPLPVWPEVHHTLTTEKGATLLTLWEAYAAEHGDRAYALTQYKMYYRRWAKQHHVVMRFVHQPGDKVFVDFAGQTMDLVDRDTGAVTTVQIFVGILGYSQYIYAEAVPSQRLPDWIAVHERMFAAYGGVPNTLVCDNLRSAVTKAHRYEPDLNPTYWEFAKHYGVVVLPARSRRPRDKALAEIAVKLVTQRILFPLRAQTFHTLADLNAALHHGLTVLNARPFQKQEGSRRARFDAVERAALRPLPAHAYEYAEWKTVTVGPDYHVSPSRRDQHFYSVPFALHGQRVETRLSATTVTIYQTDTAGVAQAVTAHVRHRYPGFTTNPAHLPESHAAVSAWTPERLHAWALKVGPDVSKLVMAIFTHKYRYPEQGVRSVLGLLALAKVYGRERLDAACTRAVRYKLYSMRSVRSILEHELDRQPLPVTNDGRTAEQRALVQHLTVTHQHARGAAYYDTSPTDEKRA